MRIFNRCSPPAAIAKLEETLGHWRAYAAAYTKQYQQPLLYNRVGWVDMVKLTDKAAADISVTAPLGQ